MGRSVLFVSVVLTLVEAGRIILVLPFCVQPRFDAGVWNQAVGGLIILVALEVSAPALSVKWWRPPAEGMRLRTTGIYSVVRHPIYLCEIFWPVGWSLMWGSMHGLALTPIWWLVFLFHALAEEHRLESVLGSEYTDYKNTVRARFFPGIPV